MAFLALIAHQGPDQDGFVRSVAGPALAVIDTFEFDPVRAVNLELLPRGGDIFIVTYIDTALDGVVITVSMDGLGIIGAAVIGTLNIGPALTELSIVRRSGDVHAFVYADGAVTGICRTVNIPASGSPITAISTLSFGITMGGTTPLTQVIGDVHVTAFQSGGVSNGRWSSFTITAAGAIGPLITTVIFGPAGTIAGQVLKISESGAEGVFALTYQDPAGNHVQTVAISPAGTLIAVRGTITFTGFTSRAKLVQVSGTVYALAEREGASTGSIRTFTISSTGIIGAPIDSFTFDANCAQELDFEHIDTNLFAVVFRGGDVPLTQGTMKTITIDTLGNIGPIVETLTVEAVLADFPRLELRGGTVIGAPDLPAGPSLSMQEKLLLL